jgi:hypothetical protein
MPMFKYLPMLLLTTAVVTVIVAAPNRPKEGLVGHSGWGTLPDVDRKDYMPQLQVRYTIAGRPGETYTVELWLGRTNWREDRPPYHFDTQEITVPAGGSGRLVEVKGMFDRRCFDRYPGPEPMPVPQGYPAPGLFTAEPTGSWDCRLGVKHRGKVLSDTGYFQVVAEPPIKV